MPKKTFIKPPVFILTKEGFEEVEKKHVALKAARPAIVEDLSKARAMGDLSENGYYRAAKGKLIDTDRELRRLQLLLRYGKIVTSGTNDTVTVGNTVTIIENGTTQTFHLVGDYEANPKENKISFHSPLGIALIGKKAGDTVNYNTPKGQRTFTIQSIT